MKCLVLLALLVGVARAEDDPEACATCHPAEHAEWRRSRHALAWTNATFQREYRPRPLAWCVSCHAPGADQQAEVAARGDGPLAADGVRCGGCHTRDGRMVSKTRGPKSPHDTLIDESFAGPALCARCHQFNFPRIAHEQVVGYTSHPMQNTVAQHRSGPDAELACVTCHAQADVAPARHLFPGAHDRRMLDRALAFDACVEGETLEIALANRGAGHRVPTGDVHRHLVVRAWRSGAPEKLREVTLGRRFESLQSGGKREVQDTTLAPREKRKWRWPLPSLGGPGAGPLAVELRYVFVIDEFPRTPLQEPAFTSLARMESPPPCGH